MPNEATGGVGYSKKSYVKPKATVKKPVQTQHTARDLEKEKLYVKNTPAPKPAAPAPAVKTVSLSGVNGGGGGYSGGSGSSGGSSSTTTTDTDLLKSQQRLNDLWAKAEGYKKQLDDLMGKGFTYDVTKDESYKALQATAVKQAGVASAEATEVMNERGILNSTVTSDRIGQIQQTAQDEVTKQIPALQQAAYGKHMDQIQQLYNMWNTVYGQAEKERAFDEDKRRWELGFDFEQEKFNTSNEQWNKEFNFTTAQAAIENALKERGMKIEESQNALNKLRSEQEQAGFINEEATQGALGELLAFSDASKAFDYLTQNAYRFSQSGASLDTIISALDRRFPGFESSATGVGYDFSE